jgi:hypothetical protein
LTQIHYFSPQKSISHRFSLVISNFFVKLLLQRRDMGVGAFPGPKPKLQKKAYQQQGGK